LGNGEGTISALLRSRSVNFPKLDGLLGGIIRVLEAIGGCYYTNDGFKGANPFCSLAELRLKMLQQISAAEADTSTAKLFSEKTFTAWMNRSIGGLGKLVTFRGLVQVMEKFIYHEVYPVPSPLFVPEEAKVKEITVSTNLASDASSAVFAARVSDVRKAAVSTQAALTVFLQSNAEDAAITLASVPKFQATLYALEDAYAALAKTPVPSQYGGVAAQVQAIGKLLKHADVQVQFGHAQHNVSLHDPNKVMACSADIAKIVQKCDGILGKSFRHTRTKTSTKVARVNNQIFRPDIWYAPPPRCNVIFPELYNSVQWSRNFMREVSRLELQSTNAILGDDALFNSRYYAPNVPDMRRGVKFEERRFGEMILEHELYTGIIPMYEKMTELNLFGMQSGAVADAVKQLKVGYGQRAANHQYFKHRFASRSMQCTGRFNPWIVAGFPTLIIDRPLTSDQLYVAGRVRDVTGLQGIVAPQFIGTCVQVSHNVSQQGGQTSYAFAQARVHRESAEYQGVDKVFVSKILGSTTKQTVIYTRLENLPKKGDVGPSGGTIIKDPEEVTAQYLGKTKLVYPTNGVMYRMSMVLPTNQEAPHAFKVTERIVRRAKRAAVDIPIEDAVRPPWIWEGWHNRNIGDTYMGLIGADSIVDVSAFDVKDDQFAQKQAPSTASPVEDDGSEPGEVVYDPNDHTYELLMGISTDAPTAPRPKVDTPRINRMSTDDTQTVEASTDILVKVYSTIREQKQDVGNFIRMYTWRPIATMVDILGSPDLVLTPDKSGHVTATAGVEGFHSRAFSDQADLIGLVNESVTKVLGLSEKNGHATLARLDVRPDRRLVIKQYVYELNNSRGLLG
jgi:hypothetical protein